MPQRTSTQTTSRYHREDYGKCIPFSIPFHRLNIIEDIDRNMHLDRCTSRSQYLRILIDKDTEEKNKRLKRPDSFQSELANSYGEK